MENRKIFMYFIRERYQVLLNKETGVYPYTEDAIIRSNRFTNVIKSDDRHTKYLYTLFEECIDDEIKLATIIYFGVRTNLQGMEILRSMDYDGTQFVYHMMEEYKTYRLPAYIIASRWEGFTEWQLSNLELMHAGEIDKLVYHAGFMKNQIVVLMRALEHRYGVKLGTDETRQYYGFSKGCGTAIGLELLGLPVTKDSVYSLYKLVQRKIPYIPWEDVNDVSNCLCEFSKYMKLGEEGRKVRTRKYKAIPPTSSC